MNVANLQRATACLALLIVPLRGSAAEDTFTLGDWLIVRGRLRDCVTWDNRIIDIHRVAGDGRANLLGLGELSVIGRNAAAVHAAISKAYQDVTGTPPPRFEVAREQGPPHGDDWFMLEAIDSFRHMIDRSCPSSDPSDTTAPPGSPIRDQPMPQELLQLRGLAWSARNASE